MSGLNDMTPAELHRAIVRLKATIADAKDIKQSTDNEWIEQTADELIDVAQRLIRSCQRKLKEATK